MTRLLCMFMIIAAACSVFAAGEDEILETARQYYEGGDYYNAITEVMRYQFLFPAGSGFAQSMLLMGKAYYRGENYRAAFGALYACGRDYAGSPAGEEALYLAGYIQLVKGETYDAGIIAGEYRARYPAGRFVEELDRDACFAAALTRDPSGSRQGIKAYREKYPEGKYRADPRGLRTPAGDAVRPRRHRGFGARFGDHSRFDTSTPAIMPRVHDPVKQRAFHLHDLQRRHDEKHLPDRFF